jgi:hypothetical protein
LAEEFNKLDDPPPDQPANLLNEGLLLDDEEMLDARVARFFLLQHTKTGKNRQNNQKMCQMTIKYTKWLQNKPHGHKLYNIFHCRTLHNFPEFGFLV